MIGEGVAQAASLAAPGEPTPEALANPFRRYLLATRPAFLTITLAGCLLGMALAPGGHWGLAAATLGLALFAAVIARGLWLIAGLAVIALVLAVAMGRLPGLALISLLGVLPVFKAGRILAVHAAEPARLAPAIRMTILAAHLQPVILAGVLYRNAA